MNPTLVTALLLAFVGMSLGSSLYKRTTCTYRGEQLEVGESHGSGAHVCTCTDSGYMLCGRALRSTTCTHRGETLEVGEVRGSGAHTCRCTDTGYMMCGRALRSTTCTYHGETLEVGDVRGSGAHACRCTDTGYMMCGRALNRRQGEVCEAPNGEVIAVGESGTIGEGTDTCAQCNCYLSDDGSLNMGCVSCNPPVQEAPVYGTRIEA